LTALIALILSVIIWAILLRDLRVDVRRVISGRNVVLFGIFVWYLIEPLKTNLEMQVYTQSETNYAFLCVALSLAFFLLAYHRSRSHFFNSFGRRVAVLDHPDVQWKVFLVAFAIGLAPILFYSGFDFMVLFEGLGVFGQRWTGTLARARYGGVRDALLELQMFLRAALPFAIVMLCDPRVRKGRRVIACVFIVWMFLRAVGSATRSDMIQVGLPILAGVFISLTPRLQRVAIYTLPVLCMVGYVWSAAVVISRTSGDFQWERAREADYAGNEMFRELQFISSNVPDQFDHLYGITYYTQLVNPIPRFVWPGKPTADAGLLLAKANGEVDSSGEAYLTRSPGMIGEMYWNFGLLGVVGLSILGGVLVRGWDEFGRMTRGSPLAFLVYCAGLAVVFLFGRSFNLHTMYGLLSLAVLLMFLRPRMVAAAEASSELVVHSTSCRA
jgi:oligosaccharide repeat unit polymerase